MLRGGPAHGRFQPPGGGGAAPPPPGGGPPPPGGRGVARSRRSHASLLLSFVSLVSDLFIVISSTKADPTGPSRTRLTVPPRRVPRAQNCKPPGRTAPCVDRGSAHFSPLETPTAPRRFGSRSAARVRAGCADPTWQSVDTQV